MAYTHRESSARERAEEPLVAKHSRPTKPSLESWKKTLYIGVGGSLLVLVVNLGFALWAVQHHEGGGDRPILYTGSCQTVRRLSIALHLLINILSTSLLCASNYGMQCLSAPTRKDIDRAHRRGKWLDIGVPSMRNLGRIPRRNALLWMLLALSSLPLHLLYNSIIFSTTGNNAYVAFLGNASMVESESPEIPSWNNESVSVLETLHGKATKNELFRLDNDECLDNYGQFFQTKYASVYLVTNASVEIQVVGAGNTTSDDFASWVASNYSGNITAAREDLPRWMVAGRSIDHCLVEEARICKLGYSLPLTLVVISMNACKALLLLGAAYLLRDTPLLTIGDAIGSFLTAPDISTKGQCLLSKQEVRDPDNADIRYYQGRRFWASAASVTRWLVCLILYGIALILMINLLIITKGTNGDITWWSMELDGLSGANILHWASTLTGNVLFSNSPQLLFSIMYFGSNSIVTTMAMANEWGQYAVRRKGLRVSTSPRGSQRTTHFLSLPYRFGLPLVLFSAVIHWLLSQSLFLVVLEAYTPTHLRDPTNDVTGCGWSPGAVLTALILCCLLVFYIVGLGFKRFPSGMPVAGSCSLAIAAACHGESESPSDIAQMPLKWGVMGSDDHCGFSSEDVEKPTHSRVYK
ncbi:hypothetical protein P170DRAFT_350349 [Aspergillus steynii IBT 23096]|uniref:DUF6536 domain-containing protein n=1 Tax=Aspergillus steynii IBT 23096 TaxID=1392250 RepID=A0A2I2GHA6_9EURO|nr:uncharacterized protein P170DRAFT_350349 [Aspergillus steynii IBT 23096]PLB52255.1 hypothetical protein P170DRAFT_350349 [Aspergillus steynii IBT 23096]